MKNSDPIITFEKSFLQKLANEGNWCVELREETYHLALHPYHLTNINNSIKGLLGKGIARYDPKLNGILLGFENIKLLTQGTIVDDSFFVHIDVSANFFLFKPELDKVLVGVVNKKSEDHVGCLVFETFNVSIPKPEGTEISDWLGGKVEIGDEISFKITLLKLDSRLPYIRGELLTILNRNVSQYFEDDETKKSKKKKKDDVQMEVDGEYKKSKRKRKDTSLEEIEIALASKDKDRMVSGNAEDDEQLYKKKKRKGKHSLDESIDEVGHSKDGSISLLNKSGEVIDDVGRKKKKTRKHNRSLDESVDGAMVEREQKHSLGESIDELSNSKNDSSLQLDESLIKKKKRKRSFDESVNEVVEATVFKKKKQEHSLGETFNEFSFSTNDDLKKKKHKRDLDESGRKLSSSKDVSLSQSNESYKLMDNDAPRRKKKRKKDK